VYAPSITPRTGGEQGMRGRARCANPRAGPVRHRPPTVTGGASALHSHRAGYEMSKAVLIRPRVPGLEVRASDAPLLVDPWTTGTPRQRTWSGPGRPHGLEHK
jgi:hypothetical protein